MKEDRLIVPEAERPLGGLAAGCDSHGEEVFAGYEIARQIESMIEGCRGLRQGRWI